MHSRSVWISADSKQCHNVSRDNFARILRTETALTGCHSHADKFTKRSTLSREAGLSLLDFRVCPMMSPMRGCYNAATRYSYVIHARLRARTSLPLSTGRTRDTSVRHITRIRFTSDTHTADRVIRCNCCRWSWAAFPLRDWIVVKFR